MTSDQDIDLLDHVLVPVANEEDARATVESLAPYGPSKVTVTHVVEKGGGVPDKTPVEQSKAIAEDAYAAVQETYPDADTHTMYSTDVVEGIFEAADEVGSTAIMFSARGGNRIMQFLSGDLSLRLVTESSIPVVALPNDGSFSDDEDDEN
jgi:nucleotide-binding universal stress UspA family protein